MCAAMALLAALLGLFISTAGLFRRHRHDQFGIVAHLPVGIDEPRVLARVSLADGLEAMGLHERARQVNYGLQGGLLRRAQVEDDFDGLRPGAHAHLRKIRVDDVRKLHRGDDADARGGALAVQQGERDGGAVVGQRERVDQILEKRHFGNGRPQRGNRIEIDQIGGAAHAEAGLHQQALAVAQQIGAAGHALVDGVLLGNLLAQRGALFIHHHNQVAEGAFGQNLLDLIQREALPLEALDDAQPLHIRDGKAPKTAGCGSIRRKQPFFLVITQGFRGEAVGDGKRADGYFHAICS